jgi:hypothetical protein
MALFDIIIYSIDGATQKEFVVQGAFDIEEDLSQNTVQLSFPGNGPNPAILNSFFGQKLILNGTFLVFDERADDYSNGSHSVGSAPYSADAQVQYLKTRIFKPGGYHDFKDEYNNDYIGRFERLRFRRTADDPVKWEVQFVFKVGVVPGQ